jgi:trehalose synthase
LGGTQPVRAVIPDEGTTVTLGETDEDGWMHEVPVTARQIEHLEDSARAEDLARFRTIAAEVAPLMHGHTMWHVNSTDAGGGVAELLHQVLGYLVDGGIGCRWAVVEGDAPFFRITKRIHNRLHGSPGDGGDLGPAERDAYHDVLRREVDALSRFARAGDVAVLHDPQTAGLVAPLRAAGLTVVWACHVGVDEANELARSAWEFLLPDVEPADAYVFSRHAYRWAGLHEAKTRIIPPCIDPTSAKNTSIGSPDVRGILDVAGILAGFDPRDELVVELPWIGDVRVDRRAEVIEDVPAPADEPLVVQVSRWDRLKDPAGVLRGFADHVPLTLGAHLLLAGPAPASVSDDPEGVEVFQELVEAWKATPPDRRERIHLLNLPVEDRTENALIVNALQREADVVVQKSLAEGFGLTVAEAMWKATPLVGSRVGGIQDQIEDGRSGLLVEPNDLEGLGNAIASLIADSGFARAMGHAARERVRERYLPPHFLGAHLEVLGSILAKKG